MQYVCFYGFGVCTVSTCFYFRYVGFPCLSGRRLPFPPPPRTVRHLPVPCLQPAPPLPPPWERLRQTLIVGYVTFVFTVVLCSWFLDFNILRARTGEKQSICDYDNGDDDDGDDEDDSDDYVYGDDDDGDDEDDSDDYDYGDDDDGNYDKENGDEDGDRNRSAAVARLSASSAAKPTAKSSSLRGTMQSYNKQTTLQVDYITIIELQSFSQSHLAKAR